MSNRFVPPYYSPLSSTGTTLPGAKLYFYESDNPGQPLDTYSEEALVTPNANPVIADAAGQFPNIFLQDANYNVQLFDQNDVLIWTADPVAGILNAVGDKFKPSPQDPADMTLKVGVGAFYDHVNRAFITKIGQETPLFVAPLTNPRIDLLYVDRLSGVIGVVTGAEAASPSIPALPAGKLPLATITLATDTVSLTSTEMDDVRELESLGLGSTTEYNAGVANGQIPVIDVVGYPAADGSQITNIKRGRFVNGFPLSLLADTAHDLRIGIGDCLENDLNELFSLSAVQDRRLDAVWEVDTASLVGGLANAKYIDASTAVSFDNATSKIVGTGLFETNLNGATIIVSGSTSNDGIHEITASTANDATLAVAPTTESAGATITVHIIRANWLYNIFLADDGAGGIETGFDDDLTATNLLALSGGTMYRAIGYITTDASANIDKIRHINDGPFTRDYPALTTADVTSTYVKPAMLDFVDLVVIGGGESGTGTSAAGPVGRPGGSSGGYGEKRMKAADIGATETITAGRGGQGTTGPSAPGNTSSFGTHLSCTGGQSQFVGGAATGADLSVKGAAGGGDNTLISNGAGGPTPLGHDAGSSVILLTTTNNSQYPPAGYGAGGRGGYTASTADAYGQTGGPGIVRVTEYYT